MKNFFVPMEAAIERMPIYLKKILQAVTFLTCAFSATTEHDRPVLISAYVRAHTNITQNLSQYIPKFCQSISNLVSQFLHMCNKSQNALPLGPPPRPSSVNIPMALLHIYLFGDHI